MAGVGVEALLAAVREVPGVRDAVLRTAAEGDRTLRLDLLDGADPDAVAEQVARLLDERLGLTAELMPDRHSPLDTHTSPDAQTPFDAQTPLEQTPLDQHALADQAAVRSAPARRVLLQRLQVVVGGLDATVEVGLAAGASVASGHAVAPAVESAVLRAVATATLAAIDRLVPARGRCGLDSAEVVEIGRDRIAVVVVTLVTQGRVDRLAGAAVVRGDARQAIARAVLGALNRRLDALISDGDGLE